MNNYKFLLGFIFIFQAMAFPVYDLPAQAPSAQKVEVDANPNIFQTLIKKFQEYFFPVRKLAPRNLDGPGQGGALPLTLDGGQEGAFKAGGFPGVAEPPKLLSHRPEADEKNVNLGAAISLKFDRVMDPQSLLQGVELYRKGGGGKTSLALVAKDLTGSTDGTGTETFVYSLRPVGKDLDSEANYTVVVTNIVKDTSGNALSFLPSWKAPPPGMVDLGDQAVPNQQLAAGNQLGWSFTTTAAPWVQSTSPKHGEKGVLPSSTEIEVRFTKAMWGDSLSGALSLNGQPVTAKPKMGGNGEWTWTLPPLEPGKNYMAKISKEAKDYNGNFLSSDYTWLFYTSAPTPSAGESTEKPSPGSSKTVKQIAAGGAHTCALKGDKTVWCWGANHSGQLGTGSFLLEETFPGQVYALADVTAITAGDDHTCALKEDGSVLCWGFNAYGELGDETSTKKKAPVSVKGLNNVTAVAAGRCHTCALKKDQTLWCWGANWHGQLGDGTASTSQKNPVQVLGNDFTAVAAAGHHTCALKEDHSLWCWGENTYGELGDGTTADKKAPSKIPTNELGGVSGFKAVAAGDDHSCAVSTFGSVWCWGRYLFPSHPPRDWVTVWESKIPKKMKGPGDATAISAGDQHSCALSIFDDGASEVRCWGDDHFCQLGGSEDPHYCMYSDFGIIPKIPVGHIEMVAAGGAHTCALGWASTVWCWGDNSYGQLGDGTKVNKPIPVQVLGLTNP